MKKKLATFLVGAVGLTGVSMKASTEGWGVPKPNKEAVSIREQSARSPISRGSGFYATRYFQGGGLRGGK